MERTFRASVVALILVAACGSLSGQQPTTRRLFISVTDPSNVAVVDLTPAEFLIQENGVPRAVTRAGFAQPMRIAILADNSDPMTPLLTPMRAGLKAFVDGIPQPHEIMLVTVGRQLQVRIQPTTDRKKTASAAETIFADAGSPSVLLSSLMETFNRFYTNVNDRSPVMVIVTSDGPENSNMNPKQFQQFADVLRERNVAVYGVTISGRGLGMQSDSTITLAQLTGGHVETLKMANILPERMKALAERVMQDYEPLGQQYEVVYASDAASLGASVEVTIARPGLRPTISQRRPVPVR